MPSPTVPDAAEHPAAVWREAAILLAVALLVAVASWALRDPRLPLRADPLRYEEELTVPLVKIAEAFELYEEGLHIFVDTRPLELEAVPHIPGALSIRSATFADDLRKVADFIYPEDPLILYGEGDVSAVAAVANRFEERGYENIQILAGGIEAWRRAGKPISGGEEGDHD
jgi:rhodanese-related sulfurtransferase